jgi:predicted nucleic acid-binding protein
VTILVDTGPLVALCDERDGLHARAESELGQLRSPRWIGLPVLVEATQLLESPQHVRRLEEGILRGLFKLALPERWTELVGRSLRWMDRYAEHSPDFVDAFLVAWVEVEKPAAIWTFDSEFRDIWRTSGGRRPRLALPAPRR